MQAGNHFHGLMNHVDDLSMPDYTNEIDDIWHLDAEDVSHLDDADNVAGVNTGCTQQQANVGSVTHLDDADNVAGVNVGHAQQQVNGGSVKGGKATRLAQYGDDFGKMGTYVENPNIKIDWSQYAEHGFERMQQRGMTQEMIDQIVANGKVLSQNNGSKFAFITQKGVAVVSKDGKLITTWGSEYYDSAMKEIIIKLFGE